MNITPDAVFEAALNAPNGHRVPVQFPDREAALAFRWRCYTARRKDREINARIYTPGEPLHGRSIYDDIILTIHPTEPTLYAYRNDTGTIQPPEPIT